MFVLNEEESKVGQILGMLAAFSFTIQYAPQAFKNYYRNSCEGFSSTGIIIKLIGAAFLAVNAYLTGETASVVAYGAFNIIQHSIFMCQFGWYKNDVKFYIWILFPLIPYIIGELFPYTIMFTNTIKPGAQVFSHIPQLILIYQLKTAKGVSLQTQHLNMFGGACGIIMCYLIKPKSIMTYFLYINSMFQAISLYFFAIIYDGYDFNLGCNIKNTIKRFRNQKNSPESSLENDIESQPFIRKSSINQ